MATQVLIAHTGQRLQLDTSQFSTYVCLLLEFLSEGGYADPQLQARRLQRLGRETDLDPGATACRPDIRREECQVPDAIPGGMLLLPVDRRVWLTFIGRNLRVR